MKCPKCGNFACMIIYPDYDVFECTVCDWFEDKEKPMEITDWENFNNEFEESLK